NLTRRVGSDKVGRPRFGGAGSPCCRCGALCKVRRYAYLGLQIASNRKSEIENRKLAVLVRHPCRIPPAGSAPTKLIDQEGRPSFGGAGSPSWQIPRICPAPFPLSRLRPPGYQPSPIDYGVAGARQAAFRFPLSSL